MINRNVALAHSQKNVEQKSALAKRLRLDLWSWIGFDLAKAVEIGAVIANPAKAGGN